MTARVAGDVRDAGGHVVVPDGSSINLPSCMDGVSRPVKRKRAAGRRKDLGELAALGELPPPGRVR